MEVETVENPAIDEASGAGIHAAQFVVNEGAEAVVTGNVGPNAYSVLEASGTPVYVLEGGTVREVVETYKRGQLPKAGGATSPAHGGMGRRMGRGSLGSTARQPAPTATEGSPRTSSGVSGQEELSELKETVSDLRRQLADAMDRLDQLEKEK